jgi:hypothetical protein
MEKRQEEEMENPPLWVWAIVVGLIIAGKYAYRWKTTKQLAREIEQREKITDLSKAISGSTLRNNNNNGNSTSNVRTTSPSSYRDYFKIRKRKVKMSY